MIIYQIEIIIIIQFRHIIQKYYVINMLLIININTKDNHRKYIKDNFLETMLMK